MKQKQLAVLCGTALLLATACKKESLHQSAANSNSTANSKVEPGPEAAAKAPTYEEGLMSFDYYDSGNNSASIGYYRFWGPSTGQRPQLSTGLSSGYTAGVFGFGATTGNYVVAYKVSTNVQYLSSWLYGEVPVMVNNGANFLYSQIEEIEINPANNLVYAIVQSGTGKGIFSIDMATGYATPLTVNGGSRIFNNTIGNGYKSGTIAFVPDGNGGYELVYSHESNVYASSGVVSWHFTISGNALTSNTPAHKNYAVPGTGNLNSTYGNGKLYLSRNGSSYGTNNIVYSLGLASPTVTTESFTVKNMNDFGYYKAY